MLVGEDVNASAATAVKELAASKPAVFKEAQQLLDKQKASPELHFVILADRFWSEGNREDALKCYNSAIELVPDGSSYLCRANLKFEMGLFHEALEDYQQARQSMPDAPSILFLNERTIRTLGPDSGTLRRQAARLAAQSLAAKAPSSS